MPPEDDELPRSRAPLLGAALAIVATVLVVTWPLAAHPLSALLGHPEIEAVEHLWTLWLGAQAGPLVIDTDLASHPLGYRWVLADPLNLVWFAPFGLSSAVLGMHAVLVGNLLMAGLTAVVIGRVLVPGGRLPAWAVACVAMAAPTLGGHLVTGMTEATTLWAAALAAVLLQPALQRGGRYVPLAALAGGAAAWGGPYTAVYAALLAPIMLAAVLPRALRAHGGRVIARRLLGVVLPTALLAAPVAWAITTQRPEGLPGTVSLLHHVLNTAQVQHTRYLGADLAGILSPWQAADVELVQATYLGLAAVTLGLLGVVARRAWLAAVLLAWATVLGLGVYLQLGGWIPRLDGRILLLPAGLLSLLLEPLGRAARWHRMLSVASLVLAPLAVAGAQTLLARLPPRARHPGLVLVVLLILADMLLASPVPWPRPTTDARTPPLYAALDTPGAIIAIPKQARRVEGLSRSPARQLLWQTDHGRPIAERPMYQNTAAEIHALRDAIRVAAKRGDEQRANRARQGLSRLGYAWIVHHDEQGNPISAEQLKAVLGPPDVEVGDGMAWRLR